MGIRLVREALPINFVVISTETNPVVSIRCKKLDLEVHQGIRNKAATLTEILHDRNIPAEEVIFMGNDVNDLSCFDLVGYTAAPADAETEVKRRADLVLPRNGGTGAIRDLCDLILRNAAS